MNTTSNRCTTNTTELGPRQTLIKRKSINENLVSRATISLNIKKGERLKERRKRFPPIFFGVVGWWLLDLVLEQWQLNWNTIEPENDDNCRRHSRFIYSLNVPSLFILQEDWRTVDRLYSARWCRRRWTPISMTLALITLTTTSGSRKGSRQRSWVMRMLMIMFLLWRKDKLSELKKRWQLEFFEWFMML